MELTNKIQELIPLLCVYDDFLLIELLKNKATDTTQNFLHLHSVNDKDFSAASTGVTKVVLNAFKEQNKTDFRYQKLQSIINRNECKNCSFSVNKKNWHGGGFFEYKGSDDTERCIRCINRMQIFDKELELIHDCETDALNRVKLECQEAIKCKAIINKLNTKLKNYATS